MEANGARNSECDAAGECARSRLVHVLPCGHPDRIWSFRRDLSDRASMGAVRYRPGPDRGRPGRAGLPDARRCAGRCRALGAAGCRARGGGDLSERACARDLAEFRGCDGIACPARGGELRARAGHRRDQPRSCRPRCARRAARPQRPLRLDRQRRRRGRHGCMRIACLQSGRVLPDRHTCRASDLGAYPHSHERYRTSQARRAKEPRLPACGAY